MNLKENLLLKMLTY